MREKLAWVGCGVVLLSALSAGVTRADDPPIVMRNVIERHLADEGALERFYDVPDSEARFTHVRQFQQQELEKLGKIPFVRLDQDGKVDYLLLKYKLNFDLQELDHEQKQVQEIGKMVPFEGTIAALEESRQAMQPINPEEAAKTLSNLLTQIKDAQKQQKSAAGSKTGNIKVLARRAATLTDRLRFVLKRWYSFYDDFNPEFTWWAREPYPKVDAALSDYAKYLRNELEGAKSGEDEPLVGDPIGREALLDALKAEMIPYTPEELIDIANREFAWCEVEMKRAARDMGCGDDWHKALEKVDAMHVQPGQQPQLIRRLAEEAIKFVEDRDLVTIPPLCKETWRMEMMPVESQKVTPYFTGGEEVRVSFPTDTMSTADKLMSMRGNNIPFCRATVLHELIPGHHLQIFMAQRYKPYRRTFRTPFLVEGWALYWETRFWDLNFPRTPEERVGMLFWRAHRCARIIFSLKFHLRQMTPDEAVQMLVDRVGHERRNATAEVRRSIAGDYGPLYQAAYMLGALQLRALREKVVKTGKMTDRQFNDAVLRENAIPVAMIRASLTHEQLTPDYTPDWRFYDELTGAPTTQPDKAKGEQ